jgi:hypothetical protein
MSTILCVDLSQVKKLFSPPPTLKWMKKHIFKLDERETETRFLLCNVLLLFSQSLFRVLQWIISLIIYTVCVALRNESYIRITSRQNKKHLNSQNNSKDNFYYKRQKSGRTEWDLNTYMYQEEGALVQTSKKASKWTQGP